MPSLDSRAQPAPVHLHLFVCSSALEISFSQSCPMCFQVPLRHCFCSASSHCVSNVAGREAPVLISHSSCLFPHCTHQATFNLHICSPTNSPETRAVQFYFFTKSHLNLSSLLCGLQNMRIRRVCHVVSQARPQDFMDLTAQGTETLRLL